MCYSVINQKIVTVDTLLWYKRSKTHLEIIDFKATSITLCYVTSHHPGDYFHKHLSMFQSVFINYYRIIIINDVG